MDRLPDDMLTRYVAGDASLAERDRVEEALARDPAAQLYVARLRRYWTAARAARQGNDLDWDTRHEWAKLSGRLGLLDGPEQIPDRAPVSRRRAPDRHHRSKSHRTNYWGATGGAVALLVAFTLVYFLATGDRTLAGSDASGKAMTYATSRGERAVVRLTDGTAVHLAPDSRLVVSSSFDEGQHRRVDLEGKGYFEVARDARRSFVVSTEHAITRVLGTSFNVSAYPESSEAQVFVVEGRVAVHAHDRASPDSAVLAAGQYARIPETGKLLVGTASDVRAHTAWIDGQLSFWEVPFAEVLRELERWYDFEGVIADSELRRRPVTAQFDGGESLQEMLEGLQLALQVRCTQTDAAHITFHDASQ